MVKCPGLIIKYGCTALQLILECPLPIQNNSQFNMVITSEKTKYMVISNKSTRFESDIKIILQVMEFKYLGLLL